MSRKLWLLNLLLLALIGLSGKQLSERREAAKRRENLLMGRRPAGETVPPLPALTTVVPAKAVTYTEVATKVLFSRDRNPTVILDAPAPPPPPPPMPPLPRVFGFMNFGGEPRVVLALKGQPQRSYHTGDTVGDFKLVDVNNSEITFLWNETTVKRRLEELVDREPIQPVQTAAAAPAPAPAVTATTLGAQNGPSDIPQGSNGSKACVPGDTSPPGTVMNGLRKVVTQTPFGQQCRWEPGS